MYEPIDPVVRVPTGGWPKAMLRMDLLPDLSVHQALYEVSSASRIFRRGIAATYNDTLMIAWPHQQIAEIDRTWRALKFKAEQIVELDVAESVRWTAARKAWICQGIRAGHINPVNAQASFEISDEELTEWLRRYDVDGLKGLKVEQAASNG